MGEYEDRYPEAYGHGEVIDDNATERHLTETGLPRQPRDAALPETEHPETRPVPQPHPRPTPRPVVARPAQEIGDDVVRQLNESPFIDASDVTVTVEGSEVTLDGTINSLIAISLAQALCLNTPGVSRAHVHLRVRPRPRVYESPAAPAYKIGE